MYRPHLEEMLRYSVSHHALTLLSAPAGYGKTTLLASLPSILPDYHLAWITMDDEDNDPVRFIRLLVAALGKIHAQCGQSVAPQITGGINSDIEIKKVMAALINDIVNYVSEPLVMVLDDLQCVTEPTVYMALDYLLEQRPANLRIAIGTRNDPALRLTRLGVQRQLGELRRSDLSLDQDQTQQLLNDILELNLSPSEVAILQERTEGWPGALCLLAGPLGRMDNVEKRVQFVAALNHSEQRVYDFLVEEILHNLPKDVRSFLLQTSILSEINPSVCRAVTGREDSDILLADLYRRNLAIAEISMDIEEEPVYRYHALFKKMLNEQLHRECPNEVAGLHLRAARVQTTPGRAIAHYLSANHWESAIDLIVKYGMEMLYQGMAETIGQWYRRLPKEAQDTNSQLTTLMARSEIHRGDYATAGRLLDKASRSARCVEDEVDLLASQITLAYDANDREKVERYVKRGLTLPLNPVAKVSVGLARAWLHLNTSDWDAVCLHVCDALKAPATANDRRADLIGVTYATAFMAALPGCTSAIEAYCAEVIATAASDSAWYLGAQELGSWISLWRGQLGKARQDVECAQALRQKLGGYPFVGNDLPLLLSIFSLAEGDLESAELSLEQMEERIEKPGRSKVMLHLHGAGRTMALLNRREEALTMLHRLESLDSNYKLTSYLTLHLRGLLAVLKGEEHEVKITLKKAIELEEQLPMAHVGGSARLLWSSYLLESGKASEALAMAKPVLSRWYNASLPGFALMDGPIILPVLGLARDRAVPGASSMLELFSGDLVWSRKRDQQSSESLSPREQDVLKLLVEGCTNLQISTRLHISPETVKTHVSNIFRKLEVCSRTQAAIRGKELGF